VGSRDVTDTGTPSHYYIRQDGTQYVIGFYPVPSSGKTITIPYYAKLPAMSDSQDSPLPPEFDQPLVEYAVFLTMRGKPGYEAKAKDFLSFFTDSIMRVSANSIIRSMREISFGSGRKNNFRGNNPRSGV